MSSSPIDEIFIGDRKKVHKFFNARNFYINLYRHHKSFCQNMVFHVPRSAVKKADRNRNGNRKLAVCGQPQDLTANEKKLEKVKGRPFAFYQIISQVLCRERSTETANQGNRIKDACEVTYFKTSNYGTEFRS